MTVTTLVGAKLLSSGAKLLSSGANLFGVAGLLSNRVKPVW